MPSISDNTQSFIHGLNKANQSTRLYINSIGNTTSSKSAYIVAGIAEDSTSLFLNATYTISSSKNSYIFSSGALLSGKLSYIAGSTTLPLPTEYGALRFDKTKNQRVEFDDKLLYTGKDALTVNLWARRLSATDGSNYNIFMKAFSGTYSFAILTATSGNKFAYALRTNSSTTQQNSTASFTINKWHMLTLRYDGTNCALYMDAVFDSQFAKTGGVNIDTNPFYMAFNHLGSFYTDIDIADVTMWDYALDPSEITALYHTSNKLSSSWAFIEGGTVFFNEPFIHAYINSPLSSSNVLKLSSSQMCVITGGISTDFQNAYLVAGDITTETWDTRIILDDFRSETFDVVVRIVVQGERARRFQDADVVYPISRVRYRDLPNVYYSDIPGREFSNTPAYIHSGYYIDTHTGDLSGTNPAIQSRIQNAYIPAVMYDGGYQTGYVHGHFTPVADSQSCFIKGAPTENVKAYIAGSDVTGEQFYTLAYIGGIVGSLSSGLTAYIKAWDIKNDSQQAQIMRAAIDINFHNVFLNGLVITQKQGEHYAYIRVAVPVTTNISLYIGAHLGNSTGSKMCFLHAKPTAEDSQNCFIKAPTPFINETVQRLLVMSYGTVSDNQTCHLSAALNVIDNHSCFIAGVKPFESSRRAYVTNYLVSNMSDSSLAYVLSPTPISSSKACLLNAGVVDPRQTLYIYSEANMSDRTFCYVNGPAATDNTLCYQFGHYALSDGKPTYLHA